MGSKRIAARLTDEQVTAKLAVARQLLAGFGFKAGSKKIFSEFEQLGLISSEERHEAIKAVLDELSSSCYVGPHPPKHMSSEPLTHGKRMLGFLWNSSRFQARTMYFKFCIAKFKESETLFVFSLHDDHGRQGD